MAEQTDPVIERIAQEAERRRERETAPYKARRENLRDALGAAAAAGKKK